jgi:alkenylglycerophosphocholine/alkenylglycerophosphoethanolamine hydrolase
MLCLLALGGFLTGVWADLIWLRLLCKPIPILVLIYLVSVSNRNRYGTAIVVGLSFSLVGDILLELPFKLFVWGLGAFLMAHMAYIFAFLSRTRSFTLIWATPFVIWCGAMLFWISPKLDNLAIPVTVYVTVIALMLWRAAAVMVAGLMGARMALVGAVFFAISDSCIAINKFMYAFEGARELIIVTYWIGQFGIAYSVLVSTADEHRATVD